MSPFPLIGPQIVAGSTRQQTVGRINQLADRGDGDEDKDYAVHRSRELVSPVCGIFLKNSFKKHIFTK